MLLCNNVMWQQFDAFWRLVVVDLRDVAAVWYCLKMGEDLYLNRVCLHTDMSFAVLGFMRQNGFRSRACLL